MLRAGWCRWGRPTDLAGCEKSAYMSAWQSEVMVPKDPTTEYHLRSSKESMLETIARSLRVGEIVAVEHSDKDLAEEYDYFLLKVTKPGWLVPEGERFVDDYGAIFQARDIVIEVVLQPRLC